MVYEEQCLWVEPKEGTRLKLWESLDSTLKFLIKHYFESAVKIIIIVITTTKQAGNAKLNFSVQTEVLPSTAFLQTRGDGGLWAFSQHRCLNKFNLATSARIFILSEYVWSIYWSLPDLDTSFTGFCCKSSFEVLDLIDITAGKKIRKKSIASECHELWNVSPIYIDLEIQMDTHGKSILLSNIV